MTDNSQRKCFGEGDNLFIQVLMGTVWRGMIRGQQEISTAEHYCVILSPECYYILISCVPAPLSIVILCSRCGKWDSRTQAPLSSSIEPF